MSNQPPNFAEYPRPSGQPQYVPYGRGPGVYFDAIGESFNLVKQDLGHWVAATLLYFAIGFALSLPISMAMQVFLPQASTGVAIGALVVQLGVNLLVAAVQGCILVGMIAMGIRKSRGEYINVGMVFEPFQKFGSILGANVLYYLIVYAALLACIVPAFFFAPVLALAPVVAYMLGLNPTQAISTTFNACKQHWAALFGLLFVLGLLQLLGGCACLVGLFVTWPMYCVVLGIHYRAFFESGVQPVA